MSFASRAYFSLKAHDFILLLSEASLAAFFKTAKCVLRYHVIAGSHLRCASPPRIALGAQPRRISRFSVRCARRYRCSYHPDNHLLFGRFLIRSVLSSPVAGRFRDVPHKTLCTMVRNSKEPGHSFPAQSEPRSTLTPRQVAILGRTCACTFLDPVVGGSCFRHLSPERRTFSESWGLLTQTRLKPSTYSCDFGERV
jgi:hypothetical protein